MVATFYEYLAIILMLKFNLTFIIDAFVLSVQYAW